MTHELSANHISKQNCRKYGLLPKLYNERKSFLSLVTRQLRTINDKSMEFSTKNHKVSYKIHWAKRISNFLVSQTIGKIAPLTLQSTDWGQVRTGRKKLVMLWHSEAEASNLFWARDLFCFAVTCRWHTVQSVRRLSMSHCPPPSATATIWSTFQN